MSVWMVLLKMQVKHLMLIIDSLIIYCNSVLNIYYLAGVCCLFVELTKSLALVSILYLGLRQLFRKQMRN